MSTQLVTNEDYLFFDYLAPYRWPGKTKKQIAAYRELIATGEIQIETVLENALCTASNGAYDRVCEDSFDHSDGSDAKKVVSQFRCNDHRKDHWTNSWKISNIRNKTGLIRALCLSKQTGQFHHYAIPYLAYRDLTVIELTLDTSRGYREPKGIPNPNSKWQIYEVEDFTKLAQVTHEEQTAIRHSYIKQLKDLFPGIDF